MECKGSDILCGRTWRRKVSGAIYLSDTRRWIAMADWVLFACLDAYWDGLSFLHSIRVDGRLLGDLILRKTTDYHATGLPP